VSLQDGLSFKSVLLLYQKEDTLIQPNPSSHQTIKPSIKNKTNFQINEKGI